MPRPTACSRKTVLYTVIGIVGSLVLGCSACFGTSRFGEDDPDEPTTSPIPVPTKREGESCEIDNDCVGNLWCQAGKCIANAP